MKVIVFVEDISSEIGFGTGIYVEDRKQKWNNVPREFITLTVVPVINYKNDPSEAKLALKHRRRLFPEFVRMEDGSPTKRMKYLMTSIKGAGYKEKLREGYLNPFEQEVEEVDSFFDKLRKKFVFMEYDVDKDRFDMFSIEKLPNGSAQFEHLIPKEPETFTDETKEEL